MTPAVEAVSSSAPALPRAESRFVRLCALAPGPLGRSVLTGPAAVAMAVFCVPLVAIQVVHPRVGADSWGTLVGIGLLALAIACAPMICALRDRQPTDAVALFYAQAVLMFVGLSVGSKPPATGDTPLLVSGLACWFLLLAVRHGVHDRVPRIAEAWVGAATHTVWLVVVVGWVVLAFS